jgi:periplasmic protein CpxP/Spy
LPIGAPAAGKRRTATTIKKKTVYNTLLICSFVSVKITTLIYSVILIAICIPKGSAVAQSKVSAGPQQESSQPVAPAKLKRSINPESLKRAKLTRLRKDVALTDEQATKVKPIIDAYVNEIQAIKSDTSLDSRSKRQKFSELRQRYESDLDTILNPEQQQKLASVRAERRARLRDARVGTATSEPSGSKVTPAVIQ